jgi:monothiol glutaredoxin
VSEVSDRIKDVIENEPVALFMKGTPQFVMCGNSERALEALRGAGAPVTAVDILPTRRSGRSCRSVGWPTIPQVFVKGELVGGADITQELAETGELRSDPRGQARRWLRRRRRGAGRRRAQRHPRLAIISSLLGSLSRRQCDRRSMR